MTDGRADHTTGRHTQDGTPETAGAPADATAGRDFASYEEFWPYYVAMHSKAATRWVHLTGTLTGLAVTAYGVLRRRPKLLLALPVIGYGTAWPAHFLIERNNPATFGHPAWSLRGDAQMIRMMLAGRDAELSDIAGKWLAENGS